MFDLHYSKNKNTYILGWGVYDVINFLKKK